MKEPEVSEQSCRHQGWKGGLLWVLAAVLVWAFTLRLWIPAGMDLSDLPGAAGVKLITAAQVGYTGRDWGTWVVATASGMTGGDVVLAHQWVSQLGGMAAVIGVMLAVWAVCGRVAGVAAGVVVGCWSQTVLHSFMLGHDPMTMGASWLAVGLGWQAARLRWWGWPLALVAGALASFSVILKFVALPAVAFLAFTPLLVKKKRWFDGLVLPVLMAVGWWVIVQACFNAEANRTSARPEISWETVQYGFGLIHAKARVIPEGQTFLQILGLAAAGAVLPGKRWWVRVLVGGALGLGLCYSAAMVGDKLRIRQLQVAFFGVMLLAGCGVGLVVRHGLSLLSKGEASKEWLRWLRPVPWLVPLALAVVLSLDTFAFHSALGQLRQRLCDAGPTDLPQVPWAYAEHHRGSNMQVLTDTSCVGSVSLLQLAGEEAPAGGVAGVVLRDGREFHLSAGAALAGKPYRILEVNRCCSDKKPSADCAEQVVFQLDRAGARLILPSPSSMGHHNRLQGGHETWYRLVSEAANALGGVEQVGQYWAVRDGTGSGGALPCGATHHRR